MQGILRRWRARAVATRATAAPSIEDTLDEADRSIVTASRPYSMVSYERLVAVVDAVRYAVQRGIPGAIVECGVYQGGSALAALLTLRELGVGDREVYLYDT